MRDGTDNFQTCVVREAGNFDGVVPLVDQTIKRSQGQIVVALVSGDFTCWRLWQRGVGQRFRTANPTFADMEYSDLDLRLATRRQLLARQELLNRGFTKEQVQAIGAGEFWPQNE